MDRAEAHALAQMLHTAAVSGVPVQPLTSERSDLTARDAYEIQSELVGLLTAGGDHVVGYKLGLTSKPMQDLLGVDEPDYGPILASMVVENGAAVKEGRFIQPKIEAEVAFLLERDLQGPGVTVDTVASAVAGATAALEIIDSRIADWKIRLPDTIADLASAGAVCLGDRFVPVDGFDVRLLGAVVSRNGQVVTTGAGAAALGNPLEAVAWLANTLGVYGTVLRAGEFVMTGSLHAAFPFVAGDTVTAELDRLGTVIVTMAG